MARTNGGIIGPQNLSTGTGTGVANGIWSLAEVHSALRGSDWPDLLPPKGLSAGSPAASAKEVYDTNVTPSNGTYYINNVYTGNTTRLVYCRFDVDGLHYQKWDPQHLTGFQYNGTFGQTGTHSLGGTYNAGTDLSATSTGWSWTTGTNTGQGGSATYDTGIQISSVDGHYWLLYTYISSIGGGGWATNYGLDWQATADGTDYGNSYQPDWSLNSRSTGSAAAGTHKLIRAIIISGSTSTASAVFSTTSYSDLWTKADNWEANKIVTNTSGTLTSSHYLGIRVVSFSDDGNNGTSYGAAWVHIP